MINEPNLPASTPLNVTDAKLNTGTYSYMANIKANILIFYVRVHLFINNNL